MPEDWRNSVFVLLPRKGNLKQYINYRTTALVSHASKIMLRIILERMRKKNRFFMLRFQKNKLGIDGESTEAPTAIIHVFRLILFHMMHYMDQNTGHGISCLFGQSDHALILRDRKQKSRQPVL